MTTTRQHQHGGRRVAGPGKRLGRPPATERLVSFRISVPKPVHQWFVAEAMLRGVSVSQLYREAAEEKIERTA